MLETVSWAACRGGGARGLRPRLLLRHDAVFLSARPSGACIVSGAGLFALAVAALVQAQAGSWLVHYAAWLLKIYFGAGGAAFMLIGAWTLWAQGTKRNRRRRASTPKSGGVAGAQG